MIAITHTRDWLETMRHIIQCNSISLPHWLLFTLLQTYCIQSLLVETNISSCHCGTLKASNWWNTDELLLWKSHRKYNVFVMKYNLCVNQVFPLSVWCSNYCLLRPCGEQLVYFTVLISQSHTYRFLWLITHLTGIHKTNKHWPKWPVINQTTFHTK